MPWTPDTELKDYVKQMLGTLRYDPALIPSAAPANYKALDWYRKNRDNPALFPCDPTELSENSAQDAADKQRDPFDEIVDRWSVR